MPNSMKKTRNDVGEGEPGMTEYEKQRALRIKQNMERMKALDLPSMASSLNREFCYKEMKGESKASRKATKDKDDDEDEYQPTSEDDDDEEEEEEEEEEDEEEEEENNKREKRKKVVNSSKKTRVRTSKCPQRDEKVGNAEEIDEDAALQKAIALSLGGVAESSNWMGGSMHKQSGRKEANAFCERKNVEMGTSKGRGRKAKGSGRPKMSEDDVISYFFLIDEAGKGNITWRDIKKAMVTHDFHWTDKEINDMICFFDSKGNGNLNLEDFQRIVERCGMIQHAEYD
ncbi:uncharacterized protein LOC116253716 isoform X2 [Nymphaea colorata]|uniref:uncharacterized protein LOC116253716 isoform X2 n=1 Tax=Nymphaea colorata TaxID=210225 RepID=UPI00129D6F19|nr:uncharacterized protein LOC116253716 isoform X2 [Nymphaea colorata]XP_049933253.1 uncharacterized protein LOC116253716 isoform X2 [Nymphaea colorata]